MGWERMWKQRGVGAGCLLGEKKWEQRKMGAGCLAERQFQVMSSMPASLWEAAIRQVVS